MQRHIQQRLGAVLLLGLLGLLAACGGNAASSGSSSSGTTTHNGADVAFATQMIPHHAQGVTMAKMAISRATSKDVVDIATTIQDAQKAEIHTMAGWLDSWGKPVPDTAMGGMSGMHPGSMGNGSMTGMMTPGEMRQLTNASAADFDRLWLQLMVKHHQGAIAMAKTELQAGQDTSAKALARQIIAAQQAEITTMNNLRQVRSN